MAKDITSSASADQMATILIPHEKTHQVHFFTDAARALMTGVLTVFIKKCPDSWTFRDLIITLKNSDRLKAVLSQCPETMDLVQQYFANERTSNDVISTIATKIQRYQYVATAWEKAEQKVSLKDWANGEFILILGNDEETRSAVDALNRLTEQRVRLVHDLKRLGNRLTSTLKEYFPEVLEMFPRIYRTIVADFLLAYPTLEQAQKASDQELLNFFRTHTAGKLRLSAKRISIIREAVSLIDDKAIIESNALFVQAIASELKALNTSIAKYDSEIEALYETLPDREIFNSLPCAGEISAPRLLAALGTDRSRFQSASQLANFAGISPVVEQSGTQPWTHWRFCCNKVIRQAFIEWAFLSIRSCFWAEEFYKKLRAKGKPHSAAVRAVAFKWIRIIFRMWKDKTTYSEAKYLKAL